jgi:DNA replication protein DnaC
VKLEEHAPQVGQHYRSEYQLHTADNQPFGEKVLLEFKVEADQEESAMFDSLMESMNLDKDGKLNELDFNAPAEKEERMSMMINQNAGAFGTEAAAATALLGSGQVNPVQPQAPAQPQPLSYG